jgi:penicillin-binding protein 2
MKRFKQKWYTGDTVSVGIGQGYNLATPIQLAVAVATIANNGTTNQPQLVNGIQDSRTGQIQYLKSKILHKIEFKPEYLGLVKAAMVDVLRPGGTAAQAGANAPYAIAGKTGTAQVVAIKQGEKYVESRVAERNRDHALFIAFAPADDPKIALGILVENGGHGGSVAAPIARKVFDYYILGKLPDAPPPGTEAEEEEDTEHD